MKTDQYITASNYAKVIGKSRQWVYALIKDNKVPHICLDGRYFIYYPKK